MVGTSRLKRLLVIDWDFFFYNPLDSGKNYCEDVLLYDWGHKETSFMINEVWIIRAAEFIRAGKELPNVSGWEAFSERFKFTKAAKLYYADSNVRVMSLARDKHYDEVHLFDAHHDCGYDMDLHSPIPKLEQVSCEDWMIGFYLEGSELIYRSPPWHQLYNTEKPKVHKDLRLRHTPDKGQKITVQFSDVFVCRSGAWVPSWCDDDFESFLKTFKLPMIKLDSEPTIRNFDIDAAMSLLKSESALRTP